MKTDRQHTASRPDTAFRRQLVVNITATVDRAKRDGTTGMSRDCLRQNTRTPSGGLEGAPLGTNAEYYYAEMFREVVAEMAKASRVVRAFLLD